MDMVRELIFEYSIPRFILGYKMKREVTHHTDDEAWQNVSFRECFLFLLTI